LQSWSSEHKLRNHGGSAGPGGGCMENALARARDDAGYNQEDVANALGVSRAMVSYWESGKRAPSDPQVAALSRLYRLSVAQLQGDEPIPTRADEAKMLFRKAEGTLSGGAKRGVAEFAVFLDNYATLAETTKVDIRGLKLSPFLTTPGFETADDARRKAEEVRAHLRLGLGPISDIDSVAELLGITVYRASLGGDLSKSLSGAFFNHPRVGFSILVNIDMTPGRRRFTIAHEIAHALFHSKERYILSGPGGGPRERFADGFAGEFLMPVEGIRRIIEELGVGPRVTDPATVIHLQRYFNVSYPSALFRLWRAKFLSREHYNEFQNIRPVVFAQALGYEISDEEFSQDPEHWTVRRFPSKFLGLVRTAVHKDLLSPMSAAQLTGLAIDDIEELIADGQTPSPEPQIARELGEFNDTVLVDN
jgi:Zn-dependent peptidase ImmA (M78 family)/transcriptional regulator with XRE-family HTH domain